jgi:hypothetical protein
MFVYIRSHVEVHACCYATIVNYAAPGCHGLAPWRFTFLVM